MAPFRMRQRVPGRIRKNRAARRLKPTIVRSPDLDFDVAFPLMDMAFLVTVVAGVSVSLLYCAVTGISPIPSSSPATALILELLPENVEGEVLELGAGWGTLAFPMASALPGVKIVAFELSPVPWVFMLARMALTRPRNLSVLRRNFLKEKLENVSVVVCYLHSECLEMLRPKMEAELAPGTLVISNTFDIPGWQPRDVHRLECSFCPRVYVYEVPARTV